MFRRSAICLLVLLLFGNGCTWQANRASQAVDIDPFAIGSGEPVVRPSNSYGYIDGQAQDMRSKR